MCGDAGFASVETYIASGNVVFESRAAPAKVKAELEDRLRAYAGKLVRVLVRTAPEMSAILKANPFPDTDPKHTYVVFLDEPASPDDIAGVSGKTDEEMRLGERAIYVHYPSGMGRSKLKIPAAAAGTARNMRTVATLAQMAAAP